ncbi:MAG: hypothetical protein NTZ05_08025 [Chloroflexi bacterium]|nr:hypothetical protein [Chloroflexota bacterium]
MRAASAPSSSVTWTVLAAEMVDPAAPSLQSLMAGCVYRVRLDAAGKTASEVEEALRTLMEAAHLPWEWDRDGEIKRVDLRALIEDVWLEAWQDAEVVLGMRLVHDSNAAGRPEHVAQALGFAGFPLGIHRAGLVLREQHSTPAQLAARLAQSARDRERGRTGSGARPAPRSRPAGTAGNAAQTSAAVASNETPPGGADC